MTFPELLHLTVSVGVHFQHAFYLQAPEIQWTPLFCGFFKICSGLFAFHLAFSSVFYLQRILYDGKVFISETGSVHQ